MMEIERLVMEFWKEKQTDELVELQHKAIINECMHEKQLEENQRRTLTRFKKVMKELMDAEIKSAIIYGYNVGACDMIDDPGYLDFYD